MRDAGCAFCGAAAMMCAARVSIVFALLLAAGPVGAQPAGVVRSWDFAVTLDGDPIGTHRFEIRQSGPSLTMRGQADFAVKLFGLTLYRYRHEITSTTNDTCLASLSAQTDDGGEKTSVTLNASASTTRVVRLRAGAAETGTTVAGCLMDFAYWDPRLLSQTRLLNPQTGEIETVEIVPARTGTVAARGVDVSARSWRISGAAQPVEVWYSTSGAWIGLDANVKGNRTLSYRLP